MEDQTKLDDEYKSGLKFIRAYIVNLSDPSYVSHCRIWLERISACSVKEKAVRNSYMNELCRQIQNGKLEEPFTLPPPTFGNVNVLDSPEVAETNSWSDLSTISTTTLEVAASGDSQGDATLKNASNMYEMKVKEQNEIIEDLKQRNIVLTEHLNECSVQLNARNTETDMGINMLAGEVDHLKVRLKELITMKRNLQANHNAIIIQWQNTTCDLQSKLDGEQLKSTELRATINELENKLKDLEEIDQNTSVGDNFLEIHENEISVLEEKHNEMLKCVEDKYTEIMNNKDKETEAQISDLKLSYEQKIEELIADAGKKCKLKDDEIMKLQKVVEEQCDRMQQEVVTIRSQMEHDTSCNNETLVEKVSFMQECILKMEKLLRKYENNYTRKIFSLNKELQMKENSFQIQLATQRAQLLSHANAEKHLEIEGIVSQLENRYRTLLEEQQAQSQTVRLQDLDNIKELTDKLEGKNINIYS